MNQEQKLKRLNDLLNTIFFQIVQLEEASLKRIDENLSVREIHVLEAVDSLQKTGKHKMMDVANLLGISPGSLSTGVTVLVRKGYIQRMIDPKDHRIIYVSLTKKGEKANQIHLRFHERLLKMAEHYLSAEQKECMLSILNQIECYFVENIEQIG